MYQQEPWQDTGNPIVKGITCQQHGGLPHVAHFDPQSMTHAQVRGCPLLQSQGSYPMMRSGPLSDLLPALLHPQHLLHLSQLQMHRPRIVQKWKQARFSAQPLHHQEHTIGSPRLHLRPSRPLPRCRPSITGSTCGTIMLCGPDVMSACATMCTYRR